TAAQQTRALVINTLNQQEVMKTAGSDNAFDFNNPDELLLGQSAFSRRWGNSQGSDNCRYEVDNGLASNSKRNRVTAVANEEATEEFDSDVYLNMVRDSYLKEVPLTQGALDSMHRQIHDQLIVIGNIYRDYTQTNTD